MLLADLPIRVIRLANVSAPVTEREVQATYPFQRGSTANGDVRSAIMEVLRRRETPRLVRSSYILRHVRWPGLNAASIGRTCACMARDGLIVGVTRGEFAEWSIRK